MSNYLEKYWLAIVGFLLVVLVAGGIILAIKQGSHKPVEIALSQTALLCFANSIYGEYG